MAVSICFFAVRYMMDRFFHSQIFILSGTVIICAAGYFAILILIKDPYLKEAAEQILKRMRKII